MSRYYNDDDYNRYDHDNYQYNDCHRDWDRPRWEHENYQHEHHYNDWNHCHPHQYWH
jgi:hypothetical protein